ncbi:hypothetical protein ACFQ6U_21145 [Streptomyces sp. NPDC056465]
MSRTTEGRHTEPAEHVTAAGVRSAARDTEEHGPPQHGGPHPGDPVVTP